MLLDGRAGDVGGLRVGEVHLRAGNSRWLKCNNLQKTIGTRKLILIRKTVCLGRLECVLKKNKDGVQAGRSRLVALIFKKALSNTILQVPYGNT